MRWLSKNSPLIDEEPKNLVGNFHFLEASLALSLASLHLTKEAIYEPF